MISLLYSASKGVEGCRIGKGLRVSAQEQNDRRFRLTQILAVTKQEWGMLHRNRP